MFKKIFGTILLAGALSLSTATTLMAAEYDDGQIMVTRSSLAGKRVGYVPLSMGIDLTQVWYEALRRDAERFDYEIVVREANWNVQAGAQAINQLIGEKVDLLIIHPLETQAYVKLVRKAAKAGIPVVQVNMKSPNTGDAYVGANWSDNFTLMAEKMYEFCAPENGGNGKIAIIQGNLTSPASYIGSQAMAEYFAEHPGLEIVSDQPADYDSTKAKAVASTVLKQHPDLCGFIGFWEVMDMGTAAAVREAGLKGKVKIVTSGGGEQKAACANVANGNFAASVSYEAAIIAQALSTVVVMLLQNKPVELGANPFGVYTANKVITIDNANDNVCWSMENIRKNGF